MAMHLVQNRYGTDALQLQKESSNSRLATAGAPQSIMIRSTELEGAN